MENSIFGIDYSNIFIRNILIDENLKRYRSYIFMKEETQNDEICKNIYYIRYFINAIITIGDIKVATIKRDIVDIRKAYEYIDKNFEIILETYKKYRDNILYFIENISDNSIKDIDKLKRKINNRVSNELTLNEMDKYRRDSNYKLFNYLNSFSYELISRRFKKKKINKQLTLHYINNLAIKTGTNIMINRAMKQSTNILFYELDNQIDLLRQMILAVEGKI